MNRLHIISASHINEVNAQILTLNEEGWTVLEIVSVSITPSEFTVLLLLHRPSDKQPLLETIKKASN
jgi:hypothetical protein